MSILAQAPVDKRTLECAAWLSITNTHTFEADSWLSAVALPTGIYASGSGSHCRDFSIVCGAASWAGSQLVFANGHSPDVCQRTFVIRRSGIGIIVGRIYLFISTIGTVTTITWIYSTLQRRSGHKACACTCRVGDLQLLRKFATSAPI